jgi:F-type H+-transporting ATPase subunit b
MELVTPGLGLIVWTALIFLLLLALLAKFAWKPIMGSINKRNQSIEDALKSAETARQEMQLLQDDNRKMLADIAVERDRLLKEAREFGDNIMAKAKVDAKLEIDKLKENAHLEINALKMAALSEMKTQVAVLSVDIAEKILRHALSADEKQDELINEMLKDINLN